MFKKLILLSFLTVILHGCNFTLNQDQNGCSSQSAGQWCDSQGIKSKTLRGE